MGHSAVPGLTPGLILSPIQFKWLIWDTQRCLALLQVSSSLPSSSSGLYGTLSGAWPYSRPHPLSHPVQVAYMGHSAVPGLTPGLILSPIQFKWLIWDTQRCLALPQVSSSLPSSSSGLYGTLSG